MATVAFAVMHALFTPQCIALESVEVFTDTAMFPVTTGNIAGSVKTSTDSRAMDGGANKADNKPKTTIVNAESLP